MQKYMNKSISSSPFYIPLCILASIPALFLLPWCCYRVNFSIGLPLGHFRSFSNPVLRNRGIVLAALLFTRLSVCSCVELVGKLPLLEWVMLLTRALESCVFFLYLAERWVTWDFSCTNGWRPLWHTAGKCCTICLLKADFPKFAHSPFVLLWAPRVRH